MTETLKIGIIQFDILQNEIDANLAILEEIFYANIVNKKYDIIVLPEMFNSGFGNNSSKNAEYINGKSHKWMQNMAIISNSLIIGSLPIKENSKIYNQLLAVSPNNQTNQYNKRHLFTYGGENNEYTSGNSSGLFSYKSIVIKPIICYDLRFPVWCRNTPQNTYDLLICVANWPASRKKAWDTLIKARAIENQCYVIASNRIGTDAHALIYEGGSDIIDFKGDSILAAEEPNNIILTATINLPSLREFRTKFPFINDADNFTIEL